MVSVLAIAHIILSIFLIVLVLIQDPKGGASGGMFGGGGSNSLFGATGAPSFLAKVTRWAAVVFAVTCIAMTAIIKPSSQSVLDQADVAIPAKQETVAPAPTAEPAAEEAPTETPEP